MDVLTVGLFLTSSYFVTLGITIWYTNPLKNRIAQLEEDSVNLRLKEIAQDEMLGHLVNAAQMQGNTIEILVNAANRHEQALVQLMHAGHVHEKPTHFVA